MKKNTPYDPQDIESLMLLKSFEELYPEEREFVLQHVESMEEYEEMRKLLGALHAGEGADPLLQPDPSIRRNLMRDFPVARRNRLALWWQTIITGYGNSDSIQWYHRPAFRYALAVGMLVIGVIVLYQDRDIRFAEVKQEQAAATIDSTLVSEEPPVADSLLPQPPKPSEALPPPIVFSTDEYDQHEEALPSTAAKPSIPSEELKDAEWQGATDGDIKIAGNAAATPASTGSMLSEKSISAARSVANNSVDASAEVTSTLANEVPGSVSLRQVSGLLDLICTAR